MIEKSGFSINTSKFRVQKRNERQKVTGLVVNEKVNVERKYLRVTRSLVHKWREDKLTSALLFVTKKGLRQQIMNMLYQFFAIIFMGD